MVIRVLFYRKACLRHFSHFNFISGYMSLLMPTWHPVRESEMPAINLPPDLAAELPPEMVKLEHRTQVSSLGYVKGECCPSIILSSDSKLRKTNDTMFPRNLKHGHPKIS